MIDHGTLALGLDEDSRAAFSAYSQELHQASE